MIMNDYRFGNFVCMLREKKGLTQAEIAQKLGVTPAAVSKWENGSSKPRVEVLFQLAGILDVRPEELMAGEYIAGETLNPDAVKQINERYEYLRKIDSFDIGRRRLGLALAVDERHDLDIRKALFRLRAEFAQKVDDRRADGAVFLDELLTFRTVAKLPAGVVGAHVEDVGTAAFLFNVPENALFEEFSQARIGKAVLAVEDALAFPVHREVFGMGDLHVGQILLLHPVERRRLAVRRQKIMHGVAPERAHDLIVPRNRDLGGVQSFAHSAHLPLTEKEKRRFETVVRAGASAERTERKIEPAPRFAAFHRKTALRNFNSAAHVEEPETEILLQPGVGGVARAVLSVAEKMDIAVFRENAVLARLERREIESFRRDGVVDAF